jgi:hypothetical protein
MDVLADASEILAELAVHFESSANEAAASDLGNVRDVSDPGAVTLKGAAGTNVASDALSNLSSSGVTGGALTILGEDYGEGFSIVQERSHAFAMKSQLEERDVLGFETDAGRGGAMDRPMSFLLLAKNLPILAANSRQPSCNRAQHGLRGRIGGNRNGTWRLLDRHWFVRIGNHWRIAGGNRRIRQRF